MSGAPEVYGEKGALGVVVFHDLHGRDDHVAAVADALAAAGFPAATVDLFDGRVPASLDEGRAIRASVTPETVLRKAVEARTAVQRRLVPHAPIGTLGFCVGGGYALLAAARGRFAFAIDFYGRVDPAAEIRGLEGPLLLVLGSEDGRVTPWAFSELLPAARSERTRVSVELYPGVGHGFHRPGGEGHDPAAAAHAWQRTLAFLVAATSSRSVK